MKSAGRYEIQSPINAGAVDSYTARDPESGQTVLLHVLPPGHESDPQAGFLQFAPGCPGKILDSGVDAPTQRAFVVTEYPKDRKALLLWIKSLSGIAAKPAAPKPATPPPAPAGNAGATRMFDPAAIFGGAPSAPAEKPAAAAAPAEAGGTRMFDPAAICGAPAPPAPQPSSPSANDGATRMFDPAAVFGGGASAPSAQPEATPAPQKTPPPPTRDNRPRTDPFADLKAALARSGAPSQSTAAKTPDANAAKKGEFTRRFELPKEFRGAPMRVDRTSQTPAVQKPGATGQDAADPKGVLTLMMEAYAKRKDGEAAPPPDQPAQAAGSDGATRMLDAAALFGEIPPAPPAAEPANPPAPPTYQATQRMPAIRPEDEKK